MVTNAEVQAMYHAFNKRWFGNRLPKDMVVRFEKIPGYMGVSEFYHGRPVWINLSKSIKYCRRSVAMTLLHEMVHVECPKMYHGTRFHKRMLKLARQGAFKNWW